MSQEIISATTEGAREERFRLDVFEEGEHWTSALSKLDEFGEPQEAKVAPRFYGLTYEQARRRMLDVLEKQYDDVKLIKNL